ncbi:uncharacterized protein LOC125507206 [Triticum urartu]|uniref:uncharacterized protein LOC125507206 n=1 Tax=Triticum urartu TaxID=4572 RepID=UPI0020431067|nr:uncharacterized protein LOC125507206 [Triticum urartu]
MKYLPDLPEDIWWHIHSLMPMRDAARAACVSRTFMCSWRLHTSLTFSRKTLGMDDSVCEMDGKAKDLTGKVDKIWIEHPGIGVKKVKIKFYDYRTRAYYLDRWLQISVTPGIEELTVIPSVSKQKFNFPCSLLSEGGENSIRCLNLYQCVFCPTVRLGLRSLTQLELFDVRITGNELACLLDNSVALQHLAVMYCSKIIRLKIPSLLQRLITLEVSNCKRLQSIEIEAQCLSNFRFISDHLAHLSFGEALQLKTLVMQCRGALCYARANLPSSLSNLETLSICSHCEVYCEFSGDYRLLKFFMQMVTTPMIGSKFSFLKHLTVVLAAPPAYDYCSLISFFDASPSLETFILNVVWNSMRHPSIFTDPSGTRQMPEHRHDKLKSVTITGFSSAKCLVELTCHILESAKSLEYLTLDTTDGNRVFMCSVNGSDKCYCSPMGRDAIVEARRGLLAIRTYIEGIVPSKVKFTLVEPCSRCHAVEL